jgi:RNA polymerase sigma factor (sigma-70 family)
VNGRRLEPAAEHLLRETAPRVLGAVARRCGDFAAAEDAVQEALLAAFEQWPEQGVPANPSGWLYRIATRRLHDEQSSASARRRREEAIAPAERAPAPAPDLTGSAGADAMHPDDTLILFFLCCHPALSEPSAIALTLRAVGGLTTAEIANAFLVPEATMAQRISRAKQTLALLNSPFELPTAAERAARLGAVLHVLYLVFNEGYVGSAGAELVRVELSGEAIRLAKLLHAMQPDERETAGLLALMVLTDARRAARTGPEGQLIPLDEQDRSKWDRAAITAGTELIDRTLARGSVGPYQIQAAIAALHDGAPSTAATDWPQILALYDLLKRMGDHPMVALNHAVAYAMVHGPRAGLELLTSLESDARLARHWRLDAVRGHLFEFAGDRASAIRHYLAASERTVSLPERNYLTTKAARLREIS